VYFADPKVAVAALIEQNGKVLLARRAIEPERGRWTLPAGFVDAGEDPAETVVRECFEETGLQVNVLGVREILSGREHKAGADILIVYRVEVLNGSLRAGDDVDAVAYFSREHLPPLAFGSTAVILQV
jgi:ADP-ribose pyrophosphatase YjhB (NUDIX family)